MFTLLLFISSLCFGQLNYTESEILKKNGKPDEIIDDGKKYVLIYHKHYDYLDDNDIVAVGFSLEYKGSNAKCFMATIVHQKKYLNKFYNIFFKNFVKESENVYIDYVNNSKWILQTDTNNDPNFFIVNVVNL